MPRNLPAAGICCVMDFMLGGEPVGMDVAGADVLLEGLQMYLA